MTRGKRESDTESSARTIQIDPKFASLIPPLSKEELHRLELSLLAEGCREPLIVWEEKNILLDGHNRRELCNKHDIPFQVEFVELPNREAAQQFIVSLQLGRRNLTPEAFSYLRGKRYEAEKQPQGGDRTSEEATDQNDRLETAQRLAQEFKVAEATIRRDAAFARAIDSIAENCGDDARLLLLSRDTRVTRRRILQLSKLKPPAQRKFLDVLKREGKPPRRKKQASQRQRVVLPTEPKMFAEKLVKSLDRAEVAEIVKVLNQLLKKTATEDE